MVWPLILWVSLVYSFDCYLNLAHHSVKKAAPEETETEILDDEEKSSQKTEENAEIDETEEENDEETKTDILIDDGFSV